jgi:membrane protease YdiL (CAAX protease family)
MNPYPPVVFAEPDEPFWGFSELFATAAFFVVALLVVAAAFRPFVGSDVPVGYWAVLEESIAYFVAFTGLKFLFARQRQPLLASLGWVDSPFPVQWLIATGITLSLLTVVLSVVLRTPDIETPFEKILSDPLSRVTIAIFGVLCAPLIEELLFRGLLQPRLVATFGVLPGILITSSFFGALHLVQNAMLWQSFVLITIVGFVLGVIRHVSGSTKASTIVHIAYNTLPLIGLIAQSPQKPS